MSFDSEVRKGGRCENGTNFGIGTLAALHWFVRPALRTGILQARGRTYSRAEQPALFWLGGAFWVAMAVLLAYPAVMVVLQFWRRFLG